MMTDFRDKATKKGYKMVDLAKRWGISARQMSNISKDPKQIHLDALAGLRKRGKQ